MMPTRPSGLVVMTLVAAIGCHETVGPVLGPPSTPPLPDAVPPLPSPAQVAWQEQEVAAFLHFGMNTFTNSEQGDGKESPTLFNPAAFDARQWITALRSAGIREALLTAKHHDGFCLWQTRCTSHSVAASPFQAGQGDVVRQFVDAAREGNLRVGLALSPLDRHDPSYGTPAYLDVFRCQLTELLTNYGALDELWLWQAPGVPEFDWESLRQLVKDLQPQILLQLANAAPQLANDVRSAGLSGPSNAPPPDPSSVQLVGTQMTAAYIPAEAVYSLRPSWFWHPAEDGQVKTVDQLVDLYIDTVGRNSLLRLNVPPTTRGVLADPDVAVLNAFGPAIAALYRTNVAAGRKATADSVFRNLPLYGATAAVDGKPDTFWAAAEGQHGARLEIDLGGSRAFDLLSLEEPLALGERTTRHHVEARTNGAWMTIASGTTIGQRTLHRLGPVTADRVALVISEARGAPAIAEFGIYDTGRAR